MRSCAGPLVLAVFLAAATAASALDLRVEAPPEFAAEAARVAALADADFSPVAGMLGVTPDGLVVRVILAGESSPLAAHAASWVSGYALAPIDTIVLFPSRVPSYPDRTLEALVEHELAHVLIFHAAGGGRLPPWFNEGLATVAAREWGIEDRARVALAVIGRGPRTTAELDEGFLGDGTAAVRSYAMSAALMRHLLARFGPQFVSRTLAAVADGASFDDAFRSTTGTSPDLAAALFFRRETLWNTWVPFLTSTTALWTGITLLTLAAIRSRRRRDAEIRARWEAEERALARPPRSTADAGEKFVN